MTPDPAALGEEPVPRRAPRLSLVFLGVIVVGLALGWILRTQPVDVAQVDRPAPGFRVELLDGDHFDLDEHMAVTPKVVVVNLWASWCIPCRTEMPEISAFALANPGVTVIGVSVQDTEAAARAFADEIQPSYALALGNPEFESAYPWLGLPATYVIDSNGVVAILHNGIVDVATLEEMVEGL
jgi:cytochrome c biogenesis protein CcmG, thiol:disulfide interchange protein DsbE